MTALHLREIPADSALATELMDELNHSLAGLSGDSGASAFDPACCELFVVAQDGQGQGLGCGALRPLQDGVAELKRMYARPGTQGVGSALLAQLEQSAAQRGYRALWLETRRINERALAFYRRHGYAEIVNFGSYAGRDEAICLGKTLGPRPVAADEMGLIEPLTALLVDVVEHGNSLGFLAPVSTDEIRAYWRAVFAKLPGGQQLWVLQDGDHIIGSVQLERCGKANGRHRAEVQKLIVHSSARGRGLARRLMEVLEAAARGAGISTLVLDTEVASAAETVYQRLGWHRAGEIPAFAAGTDGALQGTALYYKLLK